MQHECRPWTWASRNSMWSQDCDRGWTTWATSSAFPARGILFLVLLLLELFHLPLAASPCCLRGQWRRCLSPTCWQIESLSISTPDSKRPRLSPCSSTWACRNSLYFAENSQSLLYIYNYLGLLFGGLRLHQIALQRLQTPPQDSILTLQLGVIFTLVFPSLLFVAIGKSGYIKNMPAGVRTTNC